MGRQLRRGGAAGGSNIPISIPAEMSECHVRLGSGNARRDAHTEQLKLPRWMGEWQLHTNDRVQLARAGGGAHKYMRTQNAGDFPRRSLQLDEALGYAVRMRARAARRFSARRSSSLRPPQTP